MALEENRRYTRRELLGLAPGVVALALGVGAATGSTGPAGSSATVGPGTLNKIARFISTSNIGDSALTDNGSNISASEDLLPATDNARSFGSPALRWLDNYLSRSLQILAALSDANPILKLSSSGLQFGPGGASALDATIARNNGSLLITLSATGKEVGPNGDRVYDLGDATNRWRTLFLGTGIVANTDLPVTLVGGAFYPASTDGSNDLGLTSKRWRNIYCTGMKNVSGDFTMTIGANLNLSYGSGSAAYPGTADNACDLGLSSRRFRDFWVARNIETGAADLTVNPNAALKPSTDAAKDLGTSALRFRDLYASRRAIIASKNALVLDGQSMTQASHTVNNADTDIATYSLAANSYTHVIVRVTGYVSFVTLSTNQSINLKLKDGTTQVGNTTVVDGALSATASIPFTLEAAFVETSAVTVHITEGAAAADANTTVFVNSIVVLGES